MKFKAMNSTSSIGFKQVLQVKLVNGDSEAPQLKVMVMHHSSGLQQQLKQSYKLCPPGEETMC